MKYSITILQAEITRFENGIKAANKAMKAWTDAKGNPKQLEQYKKNIKDWEAQITELKADIKKL